MKKKTKTIKVDLFIYEELKRTKDILENHSNKTISFGQFIGDILFDVENNHLNIFKPTLFKKNECSK